MRECVYYIFMYVFIYIIQRESACARERVVGREVHIVCDFNDMRFICITCSLHTFVVSICICLCESIMYILYLCMYLYIIQRERARESARARERVPCMHELIHNVCVTFNSIYMHYLFRVFYQSFACACIFCIHVRTCVSTNTLHLSTGIYLSLRMHIYTNIFSGKTQSPKASLSCLTTSQPSGS